MTITMRTPRRVVQKAFDGNAAINAYILQNTIAEGYARLVETTKFLLDADVCPTDVHMMMGMPLQGTRRISGRAWENKRVGRRPHNVGKLFLNPQGHMRVSVFIGFLERVTAVTGAEWISGEAFAAALKATMAVCGSLGAETVSPRYLVLAVLAVSNGLCGLQTCATCRVRFVRSRELVRVQSGMFSHGSCPYCKKIEQVRKASAATAQCAQHSDQVAELA